MTNDTNSGADARMTVEQTPAAAGREHPAGDRPDPRVPQETIDNRQIDNLQSKIISGFLRVGLVVVLVGLVAGAARLAFSHGAPATGDEPRPTAKVLAVNTVHPRRKTLVRNLEQPGSVLPEAQAELYAKASGYLKAIRREITPAVAATAVLQPGLMNQGPAAAIQAVVDLHLALRQAPPIDIGSTVSAGDLLLEVDVPEREQDVLERRATLLQREEELAQAQAAVATYDAAIEVARAQGNQARADVRRYQAEHVLRQKELERVQDLVRQGALQPRLEDEKRAQVLAALGAWESSQAKVQVAQADLSLATSRLATARADVRVKQALVQVARAELARTEVLVDYGRLHAPFNGVITYRGVDEGDFIQNSQTGQTRHVMTVTALDRVKVVLQVPSREAVLVRVGARAVVVVDSVLGEKFPGRVSRVRGLLDVQSRTMQVEIDLDNHDHRLLPGMYGHVLLTLKEVPNTLVAPAAALYSRKGVNYVIVVRDGVARRQPVRIVFDGGDEVQVVKVVNGKEVPLAEKEQLVVSGKGEIADGQRVKTPYQPGG
jgi:HlyD family secretion protein